ncbi:hypothetical protein P8629_10455 [Hydrogenovibrio sp. 3SP14C1]|uniref:hypothetical protein n=1 Tax=Hydrogenovibrio sp. 3SP14C1 TaxID=3038774 RepID=UPI002416D56A|nr:hypothetical protein [Hydrogenovibrio sp. 3SP14C1]MDG4813430.1 hypothetical protein [Hydrogenovibrio sp. 3SP14C1]
MFKKITFFLLLSTLLVGCSNDLIRPDDKHIEAMIQVNTEVTNQHQLLLKIKSWMQSRITAPGAEVEYFNMTNHQVNGKGMLTIDIRGKKLQTQYLVTVEVISPSLIQFDSRDFVDLPGARYGESDRAEIFHNFIKPKVMQVVESLDIYLNEDESF